MKINNLILTFLFVTLNLVSGQITPAKKIGGKLLFAFTNNQNEKILTIAPLNGGDIKLDSLKLANKLQLIYRIGNLNYSVKEIMYSVDFFPIGKDEVSQDSIFKFNLDSSVWWMSNEIGRLNKDDQILFKVKYIVLEGNDTIFSPIPFKQGSAEYKYCNEHSADWKKEINFWIQFFRIRFNHADGDNSFYKVSKNCISLYETGIVFKIK